MPVESIIALMSFTFVISITPGPGNIMLLSSGASFGFKQSIPLVMGICTGFMTLILLVGMGMEVVFDNLPAAYMGLKIVCAVYVLKLAWKISQSSTMVQVQGEQLAKPVTLFQAALFQLVSPKAWAVAPILTVSYTNPDNYLTSLLLMIPICSIVNIPSTSVWAVFGVALRHVLGDGKVSTVFNYAMALLLVGSMIPVLVG